MVCLHRQGEDDELCQINESKGSAYYAMGAALAELAGAIIRDEKRVFSVSTVLLKQHGMAEGALSVPTVIGSKGVERTLRIELDDDEAARFLLCARRIENAIHAAEFVVQGSMRSAS
jgi:malate/lactate dehydrogenase